MSRISKKSKGHIRRKPVKSAKRSSITLKTRPAGQASNRKKTYLIYGRSGTGKTTLAGSFPGPALLINLKDDGDDSVADIEGLEVYEPETFEEMEEAYWYLHANPDKFATVIIDTITQMQTMVVEGIAKQKSRAKLAGKMPAGSWGTMTQKQWGEASSKMNGLIMKFRDLPCHTVFLAQEKVIEVEEDNDDGIADVILPEVGPAVMKSVAGLACSSSSLIFNTFIRNSVVKKGLQKRRKTSYCIRVGPNPVYTTKVRKPKSIDVPDFIANPTFEDIIQLKQGTYTNGTKEKREGSKRRRR